MYVTWKTGRKRTAIWTGQFNGGTHKAYGIDQSVTGACWAYDPNTPYQGNKTFQQWCYSSHAATLGRFKVSAAGGNDRDSSGAFGLGVGLSVALEDVGSASDSDFVPLSQIGSLAYPALIEMSPSGGFSVSIPLEEWIQVYWPDEARYASPQGATIHDVGPGSIAIVELLEEGGSIPYNASFGGASVSGVFTLPATLTQEQKRHRFYGGTADAGIWAFKRSIQASTFASVIFGGGDSFSMSHPHTKTVNVPYGGGAANEQIVINCDPPSVAFTHGGTANFDCGRSLNAHARAEYYLNRTYTLLGRGYAGKAPWPGHYELEVGDGTISGRLPVDADGFFRITPTKVDGSLGGGSVADNVAWNAQGYYGETVGDFGDSKDPPELKVAPEFLPEDARDIRQVPYFMPAYKVLTIAQAATHMLEPFDDDAPWSLPGGVIVDGTGFLGFNASASGYNLQATRSYSGFPTPKPWGGDMRWAEIRWRSLIGAGQTMRVDIAEAHTPSISGYRIKTWFLTSGAAGAYVTSTIDTTSPDAWVDYSPYTPVAGLPAVEGGDFRLPINSPPLAYGGLRFIDAITLYIPLGQHFEVDYLQQRRRTDARLQMVNGVTWTGRASQLFNNRPIGAIMVDVNSGITRTRNLVRTPFRAYVDGKLGMEAVDQRFDTALDRQVVLSIAELIATFHNLNLVGDPNPSWTILTPFAYPNPLALQIPAAHLHGMGLLYLSDSDWQPGLDFANPHTAPAEVYAQFRFSQVLEFYPGCGDALGLLGPVGAYGGPLVLRAGWHLRSSADGLILDSVGEPTTAVRVVFERQSDRQFQGDGDSRADGHYHTDSPWAHGNMPGKVYPEIEMANRPAALLNRTADRWIHRATFRVLPSGAKDISYHVADDGRHARAYTDPATNRIKLGTGLNPKATQWEDIDTGITGHVAHIQWRKKSKDARLYMVYQTTPLPATGDILSRYTKTDGRTWSPPQTIATDGHRPVHVPCQDGRHFYYFRAADNALYVQAYDSHHAAITDRILVVAGIDDAPIRASENALDRPWRMTVVYRKAGLLYLLKSYDGIVFS